MQFLKDINGQLEGINNDKKQVEKEISNIKQKRNKLIKDRENLLKDSNIINKITAVGLARKIKGCDEDIVELQSIYDNLGITIDIDREVIQKQYSEYIKATNIDEQYKELLEAKDNYESKLIAFKNNMEVIYNESEEIKKVLIDNVECFRKYKDVYGDYRMTTLKLDNMNTLGRLNESGSLTPNVFIIDENKYITQMLVHL